MCRTRNLRRKTGNEGTKSIESNLWMKKWGGWKTKENKGFSSQFRIYVLRKVQMK